VFRQLTGQRESLAWWNYGFLFTITIMPFTSELLGEYGENPLAVGIFALNLLASLATQATLVRGPYHAGRPADRAGRADPRSGDLCDLHRIHRPGLGEHRCGQVQLAADRSRAASG